MKEIQYEIKQEIAVLSKSDSGYTKEINLISWNGAEPKIDLHDWSPDHQKCGNHGTFTREEARTLIRLLKKEV